MARTPEDAGSTFDTLREDRSVWIMKFPLVIGQAWKYVSDSGQPLAKITVSIDPCKENDPPVEAKAHNGPVVDMACNASRGLLATAGANRNILVWNVDGGYCTHSFQGHQGVVTTIIFHLDPHRLLLFSGSDDATVRVWDLVAKKCIFVLEKQFSTVTSLSISENSWNLLSAGRDKVLSNGNFGRL